MTNKRPIITLSEWRTKRGVPQSTANKFAQEGRIAAYQSESIWLVRSTQRVPVSGAVAEPLTDPEYITMQEWALKKGVKKTTVTTWVRRGRITDCYKSADTHLIRADLPTPELGKYPAQRKPRRPKTPAL